MAVNIPISGLPAGVALTGTEIFPAVQTGTTKKFTINNIKTYLGISSNFVDIFIENMHAYINPQINIVDAFSFNISSAPNFNMFFSTNAPFTTTGGNNTLVGWDAGANNLVGGGRTAQGYNALLNDTTGGGSTAVGSSAGATPTNPLNCCFFGINADSAVAGLLQNANVFGANSSVDADGALVVGTNSVCEAIDGIAIGRNVKFFDTGGISTGSIVIGANAGSNAASFPATTITGYNNALSATVCTFVTSYGYDALKNNLDPEQNAAFGIAAMGLGVSGKSCAAFGNYSLNFSTGNGNSAFGYASGAALTSGGGNIFIGFFAGNAVSTASNSIFIGSNIAGANVSAAIQIGNNNVVNPGDVYIGGVGAAGDFIVNGRNINLSAFVDGITAPISCDGSGNFIKGSAGTFVLPIFVTDPVSPVKAQIWFNDTLDQFMGYNGTTNVVLG